MRFLIKGIQSPIAEKFAIPPAGFMWLCKQILLAVLRQASQKSTPTSLLPSEIGKASTTAGAATN